jgi:hypothetical protein
MIKNGKVNEPTAGYPEISGWRTGGNRPSRIFIFQHPEEGCMSYERTSHCG